MSDGILGPSGSTRPGFRRRRFFLPVIAAAGLLAAFLISSALAVHAPPDSSFQLDGNATTETETPQRDDWDRVFNDTDTATFTTEIVPDPFGESIFTGGGSKDDLDIPNWNHKSGSVPPKDEITDAYAALYVVDGELRLYFGADRFANNGSSQIGFWFFQNPVSDDSDGTFGDAVHVAGEVPHDPDNPGDILILSDFTQGGAISTIRVFEWVGSNPGASDGTLNEIASGVDCIGLDPDHDPPGVDLCGTVNSVDTTAPWDYTPKFGDEGTFPPGSFYEGGINLTEFGFGGVCFSSFLAETRSSPSVDATLKDYVLGSFPTCGSSTVTQPVDGSGTPDSEITLGQSIFDKATVTGTGGTGANPQGTVTFHVCGPIAAPATCTTNGTPVSVETLPGTSNPGVVTSDAFTPTATGRYCFRGDYSGDATNGYPASSDSGANECFTVVQIQPTIQTAQTFTVKDSATITAAAGGNLAGTVRFRLFENSTCGPGAPLYDSETLHPGGIPVSGAPSVTVESDTTTIITSKPTLSWLVQYTSTNPAQLNVSSACNTENSSLTINNG